MKSGGHQYTCVDIALDRKWENDINGYAFVSEYTPGFHFILITKAGLEEYLLPLKQDSIKISLFKWDMFLFFLRFFFFLAKTRS